MAKKVHFKPVPGVTRVIREEETRRCPVCGKKAVVLLEPSELAASIAQGDCETFAVCHPLAGGCNMGFGLA